MQPTPARSLSLSLAQRNKPKPVPIDTSKVELKIRPEHVAAMSLESAERRRRKKLKPRADFFEKIDHASVCKNRSFRNSPEQHQNNPEVGGTCRGDLQDS